MHKALDVKGIVAAGTGILNTATETGESRGGGSMFGVEMGDTSHSRC